MSPTVDFKEIDFYICLSNRNAFQNPNTIRIFFHVRSNFISGTQDIFLIGFIRTNQMSESFMRLQHNRAKSIRVRFIKTGNMSQLQKKTVF